MTIVPSLHWDLYLFEGSNAWQILDGCLGGLEGFSGEVPFYLIDLMLLDAINMIFC